MPATPVRRNGLAELFMVAVSRRGAPGGAVEGWSGLATSIIMQLKKQQNKKLSS